jgi:hypothetical protein
MTWIGRQTIFTEGNSQLMPELFCRHVAVTIVAEVARVVVFVRAAQGERNDVIYYGSEVRAAACPAYLAEAVRPSHAAFALPLATKHSAHPAGYALTLGDTALNLGNAPAGLSNLERKRVKIAGQLLKLTCVSEVGWLGHCAPPNRKSRDHLWCGPSTRCLSRAGDLG